MKIYSDNKTLVNKTVDIYGKIVKFDRVGCAELSDEDAKFILKSAPTSFKKEPFVFETENKDEVKSLEQLKFENEELKEKIEKAKLQDISRKNKIGEKDLEIKQVREALEIVVKEKEALELTVKTTEVQSDESVEDWKSKYELALKGLGELKSACKTLEIPEKDWKELKSEDKDKIIELIIEVTKE